MSGDVSGFFLSPEGARSETWLDDRPVIPGSAGCLPDWKRPELYTVLLDADRCVFAWEWTRRSLPYRRAWTLGHREPHVARGFGLERFEDPSLGAPFARPIWRRAVCPTVITASVQRFRALPSDRLDLLEMLSSLSLCVDERGDEHVLLSDGLRFIRVDVVEGSLIGCPAVLHYLLEGFDQLRGPIEAINRLSVLKETGRFVPYRLTNGGVARRFITELRVADALERGEGQQDIARTLWGSSFATGAWRTANTAFRSRAQRLVRAVRTRLANPTDPRWFAAK